jgi:RimJ/RimL family protein N-acetyltransferase
MFLIGNLSAQRMLFSRLGSSSGYGRFLIRNFNKSLALPMIKASRLEQHLVFGVSHRLHRERAIILRSIEASPAVSFASSMLYDFLGSRMIFATSASPENVSKAALTGINIYYFNNFDAEHGLCTIHEAFIGVLPSQRGKGIATALRQAAFNHFKSSTYMGITTRIKRDNQASLSSALKLGFSDIPELGKPGLLDGEVYLFRPLESPS